ncbi:MAG: YkgJ family cysteine cluster protein [Gemmatimonadales bacterium]|nr:YkgJ family cysteine cluster protein [Gemmatimonadales bacterium]
MSGLPGKTPTPENTPESTLEKLRVLHADVDSLVTDLIDRLDFDLVCRRGCSDCCIDDLSIFPVEASLIKANAAELLINSKPYPKGRCAFLDKTGSCRIYPWRPYVCRTQGLPLRWLEEGPGGEVVELRDICPLNNESIKNSSNPLESLAEGQCWTLGRFEGLLAGLQVSITGFCEKPPRASLRSLFNKQ